MWKKFFENNLIGHIVGGQGQSNDDQGWGFGQGKKQRRFKSRPFEIAQNFVQFRSNPYNRHVYDHYHRKFALWEAMNIVTVIMCMAVTHWILNYKFWSYGWQVINYISAYGQPGVRHDPMCELFPTEVRSHRKYIRTFEGLILQKVLND